MKSLIRDSEPFTNKMVMEYYVSCYGDYEVLEEILKLQFGWSKIQCEINTLHLYPDRK